MSPCHAAGFGNAIQQIILIKCHPAMRQGLMAHSVLFLLEMSPCHAAGFGNAIQQINLIKCHPAMRQGLEMQFNK